MADSMPFASGRHTFHSSSKDLTFEYIVHSHAQDAPITPQNTNILVIQCPGWGLGSTYLQAGLNPLLTGKNRLLLFFHPRGTDGSSFPSSDADNGDMSSMPALASDLEDLRLYLGLDSFPVLLGHSNGGAIALGYAEMYPARVEKLILLNHTLIGFLGDRISRAVGQERYKEAHEVMHTAHPKTDEELTQMVARIWPVNFYATEYVDVLKEAIGDRVLPIRCFRSLNRCDDELGRTKQMVKELSNVRAKTLIVFGEDDLVCGPSIAERTKEGIPHATVLIYERCGHFPWIEEKDRTLEDISAFLDV